MTEVPMCPVCTVRPCKVRTNGRSLGRCDECIRAGSAAPGTVREVRPGKFRVKRADGSWVASDENGRELGEFVSGRLDDIMARYRLVPAPAQLIIESDPLPSFAPSTSHAVMVVGPAELPVAAGPVARASDPWTSHAAGRQAADPKNLTDAQGCVLSALASNRRTDHEVAAVKRMHGGTAAKRRLDLQRAGLVRPVVVDGETLTRPTPHGRRAIVWEATEAGLEALGLWAAGAKVVAS